MSEEQNVTVNIDPLGRVKTIEVNGMSGEACTDITAGIESAVTGSLFSSNVDHKSEFYEQTDGQVVEQTTDW